MKKIFFYIDRTNKQIRFIHYPIDRKGNMIGETEQHSSQIREQLFGFDSDKHS